MAGSFRVTMADRFGTADTWMADRFGMALTADGMAMGGDTWMAGSGGDILMGAGWARASPAPANAGHRAIDTNAQAFHEGNRNLTSLAINLPDLPMDCSSEAAVLSIASVN